MTPQVLSGLDLSTVRQLAILPLGTFGTDLKADSHEKDSGESMSVLSEISGSKRDFEAPN
jgi:hypothetical protein